MSKEYVKQVHTHVALCKPLLHLRDAPIASILMHFGEWVWIHAHYGDVHGEMPEGVSMVRDRDNNGYDEDGNCVLSVPTSYVIEYYTDEEYEDIGRMIDADQRLLRYAR